MLHTIFKGLSAAAVFSAIGLGCAISAETVGAIEWLGKEKVPDRFSVALDFDGAQFAASYSCAPRKTCSRIQSCDEAVWYLQNCSWGGKLDADSDGSPCETLCGSNN